MFSKHFILCDIFGASFVDEDMVWHYIQYK